MNYLTFINRMSEHYITQNTINFLVSGSDQMVRRRVLKDVCEKNRENGKALIIIDNTGIHNVFNMKEIENAGFQVKNGFSGEYCLYDLLNVNTIKEMSRMRRVLSNLEYDEKKKMKLIAYLKFLIYVENLSGRTGKFKLSLAILGEYSSTMKTEMKIQSLLLAGIIDEAQQNYLVSKYSEVCEAAADFEDMLYILAPFINGKKNLRDLRGSTALVYKIDEFGNDVTLETMLISLLLFGLEDTERFSIAVIILDKGVGNRKYLLDLLTELPAEMEVDFFSEDVFTLCDSGSLPMILNRFGARVYSRHLAMNSCEAIERACGEIDVVKTSYSVNYDRRWRANQPWDVLMGNNKIEAYTSNVPVREPKYRKEMIAGFVPGSGIVEYMGNTSIFSM